MNREYRELRAKNTGALGIINSFDLVWHRFLSCVYFDSKIIQIEWQKCHKSRCDSRNKDETDIYFWLNWYWDAHTLPHETEIVFIEIWLIKAQNKRMLSKWLSIQDNFLLELSLYSKSLRLWINVAVIKGNALPLP